MSVDFGFDTGSCKLADRSGLDTGMTTDSIFTTAAPDGGVTDPADADPATTGASDDSPSHMCCGSHPGRFPFKLKNGARACCEDADGVGKTFNTNLLECCVDGSTSPIGGCPIV
jgi:hypothetical protein